MTSELKKIDNFTIRLAHKEDAALIVKYIRDLATYENELDQVSVTPEILEEYMFDEEGAEALIGEYEGKPIGFAFFHSSFSTFLGKPGIALVDLYIEPHARGNGFGKLIQIQRFPLIYQKITQHGQIYQLLFITLNLN